jgi:putative ABC transport system ATP-binding protein
VSTLKVENLEHQYADGDKVRKILKGIDYSFENGKLYTIAGPSGSGKTTFLSIIAGLDTQKSGKVLYNDKDIKNIGLTNYRKKDVSIVFQAYNLITYLTALENVVLAMEISGDIKDKRKIASEKLALVGFDLDKMNRIVSKLSGGEQQRVAIARAIATNPALILADEPTGNLDSVTESDIIEIFKRLAHDENKCVIVVTHSHELEIKADINIKLKDGLFVQS